MFSEHFYKKVLNLERCSVAVFNLEGALVFCNDCFKLRFTNSAGSPITGKRFSTLENDVHQEISDLKTVLERRKPLTSEKKDHFNNAYTLFYDAFDHENQTYIRETIYVNREAPIISVKVAPPDVRPEDMFLADRGMRSIVETIQRISNFDSTVLITGESGTGKSMLAKYIHSKSRRANAPFVTINCATIPENLIESELFGYVSGAFTGANQKGKPGMVELADKGTLFLDEIGLLPLSLQSKFLQLIQEKVYTPVGSVKSKKVDLRIISATNQDLERQISLGKFREDLYYRLRVIEFYMPPLRERPDAIEPLIDSFIETYNEKYSIHKTISAAAKEEFRNHDWQGNIRELQYLIERLVVTSPEQCITMADLPPILHMSTSPQDEVLEEVDFETAIEQYEKKLLSKAFRQYQSSYKVAQALGITQSKASRLLRKYNIH